MKSNVLIVEDRKKDFDLLSEIFDENNYSISYAPDGKTAFSYLRDNVFDLIILDLVLPDVDGFEICKYIRKDERFVGVPVLFLSSSDNIDNRLIGLQLGATDFLSKDCDQRELLAKVKNVLNSKRQFDEMIKLSIYDSLTHIYNRRYFQHRLKDEFERSRRYKHDFCCMMIDIDFFKEVNDTLGHQTGDDVLKKVASIFRGNMRSCDVVCRYGGDEFGILLPETNYAGAIVSAERVRSTVEKTKLIDDQKSSIKVTLSLGISSLKEAGAMGMDELLTQADVALYQAKRAGRNKVSCYGRKY